MLAEREGGVEEEGKSKTCVVTLHIEKSSFFFQLHNSISKATMLIKKKKKKI